MTADEIRAMPKYAEVSEDLTPEQNTIALSLAIAVEQCAQLAELNALLRQAVEGFTAIGKGMAGNPILKMLAPKS